MHYFPVIITRTINESRQFNIPGRTEEELIKKGKAAARNERSGGDWKSDAFDSKVTILDLAKGKVHVERTITESCVDSVYGADEEMIKQQADGTGRYYHHAVSWGDRSVAVRVGFAPGFMTREDLDAFWRKSEDLVNFVADHCAGEYPAGLIRNYKGSIVLTDHTRSEFCIISTNEGKVEFHYTDDSLQVIDPEAELSLFGKYDTVEAAFAAAADRLGFEFAAAQAPQVP